MNLNVALNCLEKKWRAYLTERGHYIYKTRGSGRVIRSRNSSNTQYRWMLLVGQSPERMLIKSELSNIRRQLRRARERKEATYLVVGFTTEPGRIVAIPARTVLKTHCVYSDRGGISWC